MTSDDGIVPCLYPHPPIPGSMVPYNVSYGIMGQHPHEISTLSKISADYMEIHGVLSLLVCAFGIPMNILNVFVLTRSHMRTPVNLILTWLAIFDLLTMASYVPFSLHFYCLTSLWELSTSRNSLGWMTFLIIHVDLTATTHTISNWLGVTLALFRYKHIFLPAKGHLTRIRRLIRARIAVFIVIFLSVVVVIPNYMMNKLMPLDVSIDEDTNNTSYVYVMEPSNLGTPDVKPLAQFNLFLHSIVAKFLPCLLMVVYSGLLLKTLRTNVKMIAKLSTTVTLSPPIISVKANENGSYSHYKVENEVDGDNSTIQDSMLRQPRLSEPRSQSRSGSTTTELSTLCPKCGNSETVSPSSPVKKQSSGNVPTSAAKSRRAQDNSRTTRMLLTVIILYVISELPQAVLIMLSASLPNFFNDVYIPLGDMMDMLALINNGINFVLYCSMSRDFRKTLVSLFYSICCSRKESNSFVRIKSNGSPVTIVETNYRKCCEDGCSDVNLINVTHTKGSVS